MQSFVQSIIGPFYWKYSTLKTLGNPHCRPGLPVLIVGLVCGGGFLFCLERIIRRITKSVFGKLPHG